MKTKQDQREYLSRPDVKKHRAEYYKVYMKTQEYKRKRSKYRRTKGSVAGFKYTLKKYKLTMEDYNKQLVKQEFRCAICGTHQNELEHRLGVDHCHETKINRGLLCRKCNVGIGMFNDKIKLLENALTYLKCY